MPKQIVPIWSPADYRKVVERAATVAAVRAVADEFPQTVAESALLAEIVDRELR